MSKVYSVFLLLLSSFSVFSADLIHPLDFKGSEPEKEKVIVQIKASVKETYTNIGMGDPMTLRMMEKEELKAFKELTKVENRRLLDNVIEQYCNIGMCNYNTILMMYREQNRANKQSLAW